jgi:hypothetical protein
MKEEDKGYKAEKVKFVLFYSNNKIMLNKAIILLVATTVLT